MLNKKNGLILILVGVLVLAGWAIKHFYFSHQTPTGISEKAADQASGEIDHEATAAVTDDISDRTVVTKTIPQGQTFPETLKLCFPELAEQITSPKAFIENWKSTRPNIVEDMDFVHYFFKDKDGKEMRAQVVYTYANNRPVREFKLFRVLEDGLPDLIEIPKSDQFNPSNTTVSKYVDFDSVFETQKKWSARISDKTHIEVEESNSDITEFQLRQDDIIFRCHEGDCECKTKN